MFFARFSKYGNFGEGYEEICKNIIEKCWNGRYFQTSSRGFSEFWVRDFAFCAESLVLLGYGAKVRSTLLYALEHFERHGAIKTKISKNGLPVDIFYIAPDSLALLIRTLIATKNQDLAKRFKSFLNGEIRRYFKKIIDTKTGFVKSGYFSSARDHTIRHSSTYDNAMVAYLSLNLEKLKLVNPFRKVDCIKQFIDNFWTGTYFKDSLANDEVSGDANIYPYWLGLIEDEKMMKRSFATMEKAGLTEPFPLKYASHRRGPFVRLMNFLTPNYQGDTIWAQNGMIYLDLLRKISQKKFQKYFQIYKENIEKHKNFLELFRSNGVIYRTFFYKADEGLLWSSMFLALAKKK
jgi:hypothetical protein